MEKNILVIDDEQTVLESFIKILSRKGFNVDVTLSSRQGLAWVCQRPYDIVFVDMCMPDMGGIRMLVDIKGKKPHCCVVLITGYGTRETAELAHTFGADYYLEKPFTPEELTSLVKTALGRTSKKPYPIQREAEPIKA